MCSIVLILIDIRPRIQNLPWYDFALLIKSNNFGFANKLYTVEHSNFPR